MSCCNFTTTLPKDDSRLFFNSTKSYQTLHCDTSLSLNSALYYEFQTHEMACEQETSFDGKYLCGGVHGIWRKSCQTSSVVKDTVEVLAFNRSWEIDRCTCNGRSYYRLLSNPTALESNICPRFCTTNADYTVPSFIFSPIPMSQIVTSRMFVEPTKKTDGTCNFPFLDTTIIEGVRLELALSQCVTNFANQWKGLKNDIRDKISFLPHQKLDRSIVVNTHVCIFVKYDIPDTCIIEEQIEQFTFGRVFMYKATTPPPQAPPPLTPSPIPISVTRYIPVAESSLTMYKTFQTLNVSSFQKCLSSAYPDFYFEYFNSLCYLSKENEMPFLFQRKKGNQIFRVCERNCKPKIHGIEFKDGNYMYRNVQYTHWIKRYGLSWSTNLTTVERFQANQTGSKPIVLQFSNPYDDFTDTSLSQSIVKKFSEDLLKFADDGYTAVFVHTRSIHHIYEDKDGDPESMIQVLDPVNSQQAYQVFDRIQNYPLVSSSFEYAGKIAMDVDACMETLRTKSVDLQIDVNRIILFVKGEESTTAHYFIRRTKWKNMQVSNVLLVDAPFYFHTSAAQEQFDVWTSCKKYGDTFDMFLTNAKLLNTGWRNDVIEIFQNECASSTYNVLNCQAFSDSGMLTNVKDISLPAYSISSKLSTIGAVRPSFESVAYRFSKNFLNAVNMDIDYPIEYSFAASYEKYICDLEMYSLWSDKSKAVLKDTASLILTPRVNVLQNTCPLETLPRIWTMTGVSQQLIESVALTPSSCCIQCASTSNCKAFQHYGTRCVMYKSLTVKYDTGTNATTGGVVSIESTSFINNYQQTSRVCKADFVGTRNDIQTKCRKSDSCTGISCVDCTRCDLMTTCTELTESQQGCSLLKLPRNDPNIPFWLWSIITLGVMIFIIGCVYGCRVLSHIGENQQNEPIKSAKGKRLEPKRQPNRLRMSRSRRAKIRVIDTSVETSKYSRFTPENTVPVVPTSIYQDDKLSERIERALEKRKRKRKEALRTIPVI